MFALHVSFWGDNTHFYIVADLNVEAHQHKGIIDVVSLMLL